jgi:hypothetical protein
MKRRNFPRNPGSSHDSEQTTLNRRASTPRHRPPPFCRAAASFNGGRAQSNPREGAMRPWPLAAIVVRAGRAAALPCPAELSMSHLPRQARRGPRVADCKRPGGTSISHWMQTKVAGLVQPRFSEKSTNGTEIWGPGSAIGSLSQGVNANVAIPGTRRRLLSRSRAIARAACRRAERKPSHRQTPPGTRRRNSHPGGPQ